MTFLACSACFEPIELYASDGGDPYRTGDTLDRCAECASREVCGVCGESFPIGKTCEACDEERRGSLPNEPDARPRTIVQGTVRGMVA